MTLFDEQEPEESESEDQGAGKYLGVLIGIILLPVLFFFTYIGKTDLGLSVFICLGVNILSVGICWDLRRHWWFWCVDIVLLALHAPLFLMVQWPDGWVSRFTLLPIGVADLAITVGAVRLVDKFIVKSPPSGQEE